MLGDPSSLKAEHITVMPGCNRGENSALRGKLNLSESRQILQNELEPSVFFLFPPLCSLHLSFSVSQSHSGCVMSSIWLVEPLPPPLSLLPEQKESLKKVNAQGSFAQGFSCLHPLLSQVSHVLNVAYGVSNLFPDQMVYKTLQILDLPETAITSYLQECSSFIDLAREQVRTRLT